MHAALVSDVSAASPTVFAAPPDLAPYVRRVLWIDAALGPVMRFPAAHRAFLMMHVGSEPVLGSRVAAPGAALVTGPSTTPFEAMRMGPRYQLLAVEFTGIGAHALLGDVLPYLVDRLEPLSTFGSPTQVRSLEHELAELRTTPQRVARLMRFLRARIPTKLSPMARHARRFLSLINRSSPTRVGPLTAELGISPALLRRATAQVCGGSPKAIVGSERLNTALRHLVDDPSPPLTSLAHALDFHDQPHFTRAFRRYSGFPPSKLPRDEFRLARWML